MHYSKSPPGHPNATWGHLFNFYFIYFFILKQILENENIQSRMFSLALLKLHPCFDFQGNKMWKRASLLEMVSPQVFIMKYAPQRWTEGGFNHNFNSTSLFWIAFCPVSKNNLHRHVSFTREGYGALNSSCETYVKPSDCFCWASKNSCCNSAW